MRRFTAFAVLLCFGSLLGSVVFGQNKTVGQGFPIGNSTSVEESEWIPAYQRTCSSVEKSRESLLANPELRAEYENLMRNQEQLMAENEYNKTTGIITIPVVVHVVYRTTAGNISNSRIQEQIDVLNADYRRLNSDTSSTLATFKPVAGDCGVMFCLANRDPQGNSTTGIIRKQTTISNIGSTNSYYGSTNGSTSWDRTKYLNIWVCEIGGGILGFAYLPGTAPASFDGVVIDYHYFGKTGASFPFNKGRTATHEVGHYLGLDHIWGDGGCGVDDGIADTPLSDAANFNCPTTHVSCGTLDMVQNYMDYTDDACMNIITQGQCAKVNTTLSGTRGSLAFSNGCSGGGTPTACDTATIGFPLAGTATIYGVSGSGSWGYVGGHNNYLDKSKARYFANSQGYGSCTGVRLQFGAAAAANSTSKVTVKVWDEVSGEPGTVLATKDLLINDIIAAGGDVTVTFASPATLSGAFFTGFEMTYTAGDTVGIITNADGDVTTGSAWEQFSDNSWHPFNETGASWGIEVDPAIYAKVDGGSIAVTVTPANPTINAGGSTSLTASGASTYTWSPPTGLSSSFGATVTASPSVTTTYTVTGTDATGNCTGTKQVTVNVIPVGVEDALFGQSGLSVYPNPNNGSFVVEFNQLNRKDMTITVSNMIGQQVFITNLNEFTGAYRNTISLGESAQGVYFLRISDGINQVVKKVVVE